MYEDILFLGTGSFIYTMYVQYGDKMGNVWLRPDSNGNMAFVPSSLFNLMKESTTNKFFFFFFNLDINYGYVVGSVWSICKFTSFVIKNFI